MINYVIVNKQKIAIVLNYMINNTNDALDIMATVYTNGCERIVIHKQGFNERFYSLRTRMAGEILQKFSNYGIRLAIVGDFKNVQSKSLTDFISECNKGNTVFFVNSEQEALHALARA